MQQPTVDPRVSGLIALSEAGEFLLCSVRALAGGAETKGHEVANPIHWAQAKIEEALALLSQGEDPS